MMKVIRVAIVVMPQTMISSVVGIVDILTIYNRHCKQPDEPEFEVHCVCADADGNFENDFLVLQTEPISTGRMFHIIIAPPLINNDMPLLEMPQLNAWLISQYHEGAVLCSACVGSFLLAQTGLLDGKRATTHWLYEDLFKKQFPTIELQSDRILIDEGRIITAGGVSAYMDLVLYLIEKVHSNASATACANILLVDRGRSSQRCYKAFSQVKLIDDLEIKDLLEWMKDNLGKELSNRQMAKRLHMQERTFLRRFKKSLNMTPRQVVQNLRIEEAKSQLVGSQKSFEDITYDVGYSNESSFRRLFKRETLFNPGEYRLKFQQKLY